MSRAEILKVLSQFLRLNQEQFGMVRLGTFQLTENEELAKENPIDVVVELTKPDLFALVGIKTIIGIIAQSFR